MKLHRQLALGVRRETGRQHFRDDQTQNAVAQKLQALVRSRVARARMRQRTRQQRGVLEDVTEAGFEISQCR